MKYPTARRICTAILLGILTIATYGCDTVGDEEVATESVTIEFATVAGGAAVAPANEVSLQAGQQELLIEGTNGTLVITDIHMIVSEFELEADDEACENLGEEEDGEDCAEFESDPFFVDLPLTEGAVAVATDEMPVGAYTELEFEVEDLDIDDLEDGEDEEEEGEEEEAALEALAEEIRAEFPAWPEEASVVVSGRFIPAGDVAARTFTTFLDAEIEVEKELDPPFNVSETGAGSALVVEVVPELWFVEDGTVVDLSAFDFDETGELLEFELELEEGFDGDDDD